MFSLKGYKLDRTDKCVISGVAVFWLLGVAEVHVTNKFLELEAKTLETPTEAVPRTRSSEPCNTRFLDDLSPLTDRTSYHLYCDGKAYTISFRP